MARFYCRVRPTRIPLPSSVCGKISQYSEFPFSISFQLLAFLYFGEGAFRINYNEPPIDHGLAVTNAFERRDRLMLGHEIQLHSEWGIGLTLENQIVIDEWIQCGFTLIKWAFLLRRVCLCDMGVFVWKYIYF